MVIELLVIRETIIKLIGHQSRIKYALCTVGYVFELKCVQLHSFESYTFRLSGLRTGFQLQANCETADCIATFGRILFFT